MSSFYTTRSTTAAATAAAAGGGIASSITIEPSGRTQRSLSAMGTTIGSAAVGQSRHYCIALTNNPRMLRNAQRELAFAAASKPVSDSSVIEREKYDRSKTILAKHEWTNNIGATIATANSTTYCIGKSTTTATSCTSIYTTTAGGTNNIE